MFIVLSLFTLSLALAGSALVAGRIEATLLHRAALAVAAGVLFDYILVLCGLPLTVVLVAVGMVAAWGLVIVFTRWRSSRSSRPPGSRRAWWCAVPIAYILGLYCLVILAEPLLRWDARSVWFFHAKMIWVEGGLRFHAGFAHPSVVFSHPDYPNLIPALAAQLAWARGFWNEYLPKASLVVMLVPPVLWAFTFRQRPLLLILLVSFAFFSLDGWLSNGYMDPYLTLYVGLALVLFGRYMSGGNPEDLYSATCALGVVANLKNDGVLVVLSFTVALLIAAILTPRRLVFDQARRLARDRAFLTVVALSAGPVGLWMGLKHAWGVHNDMTADVGVNLSRLAERMSNGKVLLYLLDFLSTRATAVWMLAGLLLAVVFVLKVRARPVPRGATVAALTSLAYFIVMYFVYLATPRDLSWHLSTSAGRTMPTASVGLLVALYLSLSDNAPQDRGAASPARARSLVQNLATPPK